MYPIIYTYDPNADEEPTLPMFPAAEPVPLPPEGPPKGPAVCTRCGMQNEYAEPSAEYVCYECR